MLDRFYPLNNNENRYFDLLVERMFCSDGCVLVAIAVAVNVGTLHFPIYRFDDGGDRSAAALAACDLLIDENTSAAGRVDGC